MAEASIIEGRECGSCSYCCKLLGIKELEKVPGEWCPNCDVGNGCKIYHNRPTECRIFNCEYLTWEQLGEHWFPETSDMVVVSTLNGKRIVVHVEPENPNAWQQEPYYSEMKGWLKSEINGKNHVVVNIGMRARVIFSDWEVDLGELAEDERVVIGSRQTPLGKRPHAVKMKLDDPRMARKNAANRQIQSKFK